MGQDGAALLLSIHFIWVLSHFEKAEEPVSENAMDCNDSQIPSLLSALPRSSS